MGKILSVGMDGALLRTRHTVLQQTGAEISSASPTEALRLLEFGKFDLLILCHTLTDASVAALCQILASRWPVTWAVLLGKHHRSIMKIEDRAVVLMEYPSPDLLLETTRLLLPDT
jgi:DNA-binding response OmpR family regulator